MDCIKKGVRMLGIPCFLLSPYPPSPHRKHVISESATLTRHFRLAVRFPVISTPSVGHEHVPEVCRIHPAVPPRSGSMTSSRLHPHFRPRVEARISIDLFPLQHMKRRLRQVACHRSHSSRVSFAGPQPRVQPADVPFWITPVIYGDRIRRFCKSPFQITIHIRSRSPVPRAVSTGMHPRRGPAVTRQPLGVRKSLDLPNLQRDCCTQNHSHSRQGHQPLHHRSHFHQLFQALLELLRLFAQAVQLRQHLPRRPARLLRQTLQLLLQLHSRFFSVGV